MKAIVFLFALIPLIPSSWAWGQSQIQAKDMNPHGSVGNEAIGVQISQNPTERLLRMVERFYLEAGDPSDIHTLAGRLGYDRHRIFRFVQDEISFEPFSGLLRGAGGTLLAGSGNSLDRS